MTTLFLSLYVMLTTSLITLSSGYSATASWMSRTFSNQHRQSSLRTSRSPTSLKSKTDDKSVMSGFIFKPTKTNHPGLEEILFCESLKNEEDNIIPHPYDINEPFNNDRRSFLNGASAFAASALLVLAPQASYAVAPITVEEAEGKTKGLLSLAQRKFRPVPLKILRLPLDLQFAIVLMRTSYSVTDDLDFIPMNQFQRDFFIIRSAEYQDYIAKLENAVTVQQGVLSDPYYFDFISYAQYAAINRAIINNPPIVFEEQQPIESTVPTGTDDGSSTDDIAPITQRFQKVVVRRDSSLSTSDVLVKEHDKRVGDGILKYFDDTFGSNIETALPKPNYLQKSVSIDVIEQGIKQILKLFLITGYAFNASPVESGTFGVSTKFVYTLTSPVTLWSGMTLQYQNTPVQNNFVIKTIKSFVRRMGYWTVVESKTEYRNNVEVTAITVIPYS